MKATDEQVQFIIDHLPQFDLTAEMVGEGETTKDFDTLEVGEYTFGCTVYICSLLDKDGERIGKPHKRAEIDESVYLNGELLELTEDQVKRICKEIEDCIEY